MNPTMIRTLAESICQAFALNQAVKVPVMRKTDLENLLKEIKAVKP